VTLSLDTSALLKLYVEDAESDAELDLGLCEPLP
jgi:predicted nucleic acid-binding protein